MRKEDILKKLYGEKGKKDDKNKIFQDRVKLYFLIDLYKSGILSLNELSKIIKYAFELEYFLRLIQPKVDTIDISTMEQIIDSYLE